VDDYGHDVIYCLPESAGTGITSAEGIVISKNYVFVRGPGRDFEIDTSASGGSGVQITGKGIELHGVRVKTDPLSSADAILISGDFAYIDDVWIEQCGGDGVSITTSSNTIINECRIRNCVGNGVNVGNSVANLWIIGSDIAETDGSAIYVNGTNVFGVKVVGETSLEHNARYGVEIVAMSGEVVVSTDAAFGNNGLGDTLASAANLSYAGRVNQKNSVAVEILASAVDGATTLAESVRLQNAVLAGKVSGAGTGTEVFTGLDGTTTRVTSTVDASGNRTAVVVNGA
jgi:hypothetical protein